jgi:hypothetical protein
MKTLEGFKWREKVTPILLRQYDEAASERIQKVQQVVLEYRGSFNELSLDIEILSALEGQLQVRIDLQDLPSLASINKINTIKLPGFINR